MTNKAYERAFNIAIKYGFCCYCRWVFDKRHCHEHNCHQDAVKVIIDALEKSDALEKLDAIEASEATVWHDAQNDPPKKTENTCVSTNTSVMVTTTACTAQWIVDNFLMVTGAVSLRTELTQKSSHGQNCRSTNPRR